MEIKDLDGLVSLVPDDVRDAARTFLHNHVQTERQRGIDPVAKSLRETAKQSEAAAARAAALEAELANAREAAEAAKSAGAKVSEYEQQIAAIKAEADKHRTLAQRWQEDEFTRVVRTAGAIADEDHVASVVKKAGIKPTINDDGTVTLSDDDKKRLVEFLEQPSNKAKYVDGGKSPYALPGISMPRAAASDKPPERRSIDDRKADEFRRKYMQR